MTKPFLVNLRFSGRPPEETNDVEVIAVTLPNGSSFEIRENKGRLVISACVAGDRLTVEPMAANLIGVVVRR